MLNRVKKLVGGLGLDPWKTRDLLETLVKKKLEVDVDPLDPACANVRGF